VADAKRLPLNLLDALRAFGGSAMLRASLGEAFTSAFLKLRMADWNAYAQHLTQWERDTTLDC
jgi:glutamine synthetase